MTTLLFGIGLPGAGVAVAWILALHSWWPVRHQVPAPPPQRGNASTPQGRLLVLAVLPSTLILFGFSLVFLLGQKEGRVPDELLVIAAVAYGIPAFLAGLAEGIVLRHAARAAFLHQEAFGPATVLLVIPDTAALFGFSLAFSILMAATALTGEPSGLVSRATIASQLMAVGSLGVLLTAYRSTAGYDFERAGLARAAARGTAGQVVLVGFFAWSYLTLVSGS